LSVAAISLAAAMVCLTSAQTLSPDEVRFSSHPYTPKPQMRVESQLVQLEVVVRDPRGQPVCGLTKDDFAVRDSGKSREVSAFSVEEFAPPVANSPQPAIPAPAADAHPDSAPQAPPAQTPSRARWIALVFDDLNTSTGDLGRAKIAAARFIRQAVGGGDHMAIFTTSGTKTLEFSSDIAAILAIVSSIQSHPRSMPGGTLPCPRITAYEAYRIVNGDLEVVKAKMEEVCACSGGTNCTSAITPDQFSSAAAARHGGGAASAVNAIYMQADQTWEQARLISQSTLEAIRASLGQLRNAPGKRMLLLASSGFLSGPLDAEKDVIIDEAIRAGVVINSLDAKGLYAETPGPPMEEGMQMGELPLSSAILQVESLGDRLDSVDSAMARFAEGTGGQLFRNNNDLDLGFRQLGLVPACAYLMGFPPAEDGQYHKVKVELRKKGRDFLLARPGYFAWKKPSSTQPTAAELLDTEVLGRNERADLQATSSETPGKAASGGEEITIRTHLAIQNISFPTQKDRRTQKLAFLAVLFAPEGRFVTGKEAVMDLSLKPESYERFLKTGVTGMMSLEAPPGAYRLRIVVQEAVDGKLSATSKDVRIPQP
jgi:VWFA-related protein